MKDGLRCRRRQSRGVHLNRGEEISTAQCDMARVIYSQSPVISPQALTVILTTPLHARTSANDNVEFDRCESHISASAAQKNTLVALTTLKLDTSLTTSHTFESF